MLVGKISFTMEMFFGFWQQAQGNSYVGSALEPGSFCDIIEQLQDTGLIKINLLKNKDSYHRCKKYIGPVLLMSYYDFLHSTITFEHALEGVESALGEIVSKNKHYNYLLSRFK